MLDRWRAVVAFGAGVLSLVPGFILDVLDLVGSFGPGVLLWTLGSLAAVSGGVVMTWRRELTLGRLALGAGLGLGGFLLSVATVNLVVGPGLAVAGSLLVSATV